MSVAAGGGQRAITEALLAAEAEAAGYEDPEVPFISPHGSYCHNSLSSSEVVCAICTNRRQRARLIWAVLLVWSVPLALATARCCGWWGPGPRTTNEEPDGRLVMVQVGIVCRCRLLAVATHLACCCRWQGPALLESCLNQLLPPQAKLPAQPVQHLCALSAACLALLQVLFRHGARTPLSNLYWPNTTWTHCKHNPLAAAGGSSSSGIQLQLYDPSGAPKPPELSGA